MGQPAARFGDSVAHTDAGFGFGMGGLLGLAAGALLVGATIATGGAALAVVAAVGGAVALTGGGALEGMNIGATYGHTAGDIITGSPNVGVNSLQAARTLADVALCHDHDGPQEIATGSTTVFINRQPAARLGDRTTCDARISTASPTVYIGGGTATYEAISAEVSPLAVTVARDMAIGGTAVALGAGAGAAFLAGGWAGVGVFGLQAGGGIAGGLLGGAAGGAIGGAVDPVHGAAWGQAIGGLGGGVGGGVAGGAMAGRLGLTSATAATTASAEAGAADDAASSFFQPKNATGTEPGAVPNTPEIQARMDAADARTAPPAPEGFMPITDKATSTFDADPVPTTLSPGTKLYRVVDADSNPNGAFWNEGAPPATEEDWRSGSAVKGEWNGDGGYVESIVGDDGLQVWRGPAAPQLSSDKVNALPGGSDQIWTGYNSPLQPTAPTPTPWNKR